MQKADSIDLLAILQKERCTYINSNTVFLIKLEMRFMTVFS